jgi:hypothetical protein
MRPLLLGFLFLTTSLAADVPRKGGIEIRFLAERAPDDLGKISLAHEEQRSEPFDLPVNNLSAPQKAPARVFSIRSVERDLALANVQLPDEGNSFIALLISSPEGYVPVIMRYDDPKFRPGDIYFHNLADKTVLGFVGTAKFVLPAGRSTILTPKGARQEKFYDVGLGVREAEGDRVLATTRWPEDNLARLYVFFFIDPKTGRITYRGVDEFVEPVKPDS